LKDQTKTSRSKQQFYLFWLKCDKKNNINYIVFNFFFSPILVVSHNGFFFFYIVERLSSKEKDYKAIKRGVLSPITSTENKFLILLGQV
jgi:hypothetical protein